MPPRSSSLPRRLLRPLTATQFASPHLTSTTSQGTSYELAALAYFSASPWELELIRVGGKSDKGVDLRGWGWERSRFDEDDRGHRIEAGEKADASGRGRRWPVIVQCKAEKSKIGPSIIRELEGVLAFEKGLNSSSPPIATIGLLVALSGFSTESLARVLNSTDVPLGLIHLHYVKGDAEPECKEIVLNAPLQEMMGDKLGWRRDGQIRKYY